jgi:hypothetical protein
MQTYALRTWEPLEFGGGGGGDKTKKVGYKFQFMPFKMVFSDHSRILLIDKYFFKHQFFFFYICYIPSLFFKF